MATTQPYLLLFDSEHATLENAGGKGAHLARLVRAGFVVPHGFIISTQAYRDFVNANALDAQIARALANVPAQHLGALEAASAAIDRAFAQGAMPSKLAREIVEAYHRLEHATLRNVVAIRSSATAEDWPGLSFAGQHATLLNVLGDAAVLRGVVTCWASLWTARAMAYRARHRIEHRRVALAVIVQTMVPSDSAGVLFTVNPLTGAPNEIVIEAVAGLGEALVGGQAEPDHYIVDVTRKKIVIKTLGASQVLSDAAILELAELGNRVAETFGQPQDIEWAFARGRFFLLQARPITTL